MNENIKKRIEAFQEIRDLPYFIATRGEQDCCCSTKAVFLEEKLNALGLQCRQKLCWFKWENLQLPVDILAIPHEEFPSHQFIEVFIPETKKWAMVDPTWDSTLEKVLLINTWDGLSDTPCAVPVERFCSDIETAEIFKECENIEAVKNYFESQGPFLRAVNNFLINIRTKFNN